MSSLAEKNEYFSPSEFLEWEKNELSRNEYYFGNIIAMGGASLNHNRIVANLIYSIKLLLNKEKLKNKKCEVLANDIKVETQSKNYFYPDIVILCRQEELNKQNDIVRNPLSIIEILSDSTEAYDRGDKFKEYRSIDSLQDYILISQKDKKIEMFSKSEEGFWVLRETKMETDTLYINGVDLNIALDSVYENVEF